MRAMGLAPSLLNMTRTYIFMVAPARAMTESGIALSIVPAFDDAGDHGTPIHRVQARGPRRDRLSEQAEGEPVRPGAHARPEPLDRRGALRRRGRRRGPYRQVRGD